MLQLRYQRCTLVARDGGERMTIDGRIRFLDGARHHGPRDDVFIVETKSAHGRGLADAVMRRPHQHPTNGCSRYFVGLGATGSVQRFNRFRPALKRPVVIPGAA